MAQLPRTANSAQNPTGRGRWMSDMAMLRQMASVATIEQVICEVNNGRCDRHERER
jgi:hypothetical protein